MLNHSREFNMLLVCCISVRLVGTFSLRCLFHLVIFFPSSKTVSLRCSFCFHVDSNRATAHASNERRSSASRDIRSIRIAITVPCQYDQQESLVMILSCNCTIASLRCYHIFLRCQRQDALLGFVIPDASFAQLQNCLVTMALHFCFAVLTPIHLFWVIVLCTISVFIPIENPHLIIVRFGKTLRVYTQPTIDLGSMPKHPMRV